MTPYEYKDPDVRRRRFRPIPVRMLVPNVITLLAICAGLTSIRLSIEGRMSLAVYAIVFAAALDGIDGRVARILKGQSKFGAEGGDGTSPPDGPAASIARAWSR